MIQNQADSQEKPQFYVAVGLMSGLFSGIIASAVLWGGWLLPALGLLITRVSLFYGLLVIMAVTIIAGGIYGFIARNKINSLVQSLYIGIGVGFGLWLLGPVTLIPLTFGMPPMFAELEEFGLSFVTFLGYGISLSLIYQVWIGNVAGMLRWVIPWAMIVIGLVAVPVLLRGAMTTSPRNLEFPGRYDMEVVVKNLTYPTSITFCDEDYLYVAEAGYSYGEKETTPRIIKLDPEGTFVSDLNNDFEGPINGLTYHEGHLYVSHRGTITRMTTSGEEMEDVVTGLPSKGDHHNNEVVFCQEGYMYFGQGSATNSGVVGEDNFMYGWLQDHPEFHDVPPVDITLRGENFSSRDLADPDPTAEVQTGGFSPFGTTTEDGQIKEGKTPGNAAIYRVDPDNDYELELWAWGLRNPYGLAFDQDYEELYATVLGYDDRGSRAVSDSPDWIYEIEKDGFYGWPDFAGEDPISESEFESDRGENRDLLLEDPPDPEPPLTEFPPHYSPMKLAYSEEFSDEGDLFVAVFGDGEPLTGEVEEAVPAQVMTVDTETGEFATFIENKDEPRSGRFGEGLNRPIAVKFDPQGEHLYLLDFGVFEFPDMTPNAIPKSGVLWRISKSD